MNSRHQFDDTCHDVREALRKFLTPSLPFFQRAILPFVTSFESILVSSFEQTRLLNVSQVSSKSSFDRNQLVSFLETQFLFLLSIALQLSIIRKGMDAEHVGSGANIVATFDVVFDSVPVGVFS